VSKNSYITLALNGGEWSAFTPMVFTPGLRASDELGWLCQYSVWLQIGQPGFEPWQGQWIFLLASTSRLALGPTRPPIQWELGVLSPGIKCSQGMMLSTYLHIVLRLRISRSYISLPPPHPPIQVPSLLFVGQLYFYEPLIPVIIS
jgi:hypothetical protein